MDIVSTINTKTNIVWQTPVEQMGNNNYNNNDKHKTGSTLYGTF